MPLAAPRRRVQSLPVVKLTAAALLAVLAAVALAHGGALGHGFVHFDDDVYVYANPQVLAGLSLEGLRWAFGLGEGQTYFHPVTWLSLMADVTLLGGAPWGFHLVNLLLHAAAALLAFELLHRATGRPGPALAAALVWAVHPLTVEAVAWTTERKAVLSTVFGLAAALAWSTASPPRSPARRIATAGLLLAGLLAKPALVTLPALLLLGDAWLAWLAPRSDGVASSGPAARTDGAAPPRPWTRALGVALVEAWPLLLAAAAVLVPALLSSARIPLESSVARPLALRAGHALASLPTYLAAAAWPTGLSVYHPYPAEVGAGALALGAAVLVAGTAAAWALRRRWPLAPAAWCWFLATLAPYLGLVQNGLWPGWAERFAYLPLLGLAALAAFGAADLLARLGAPWFAGPALLALALLALVPTTRLQVGAWRDSVALFECATAAEPESPVLRLNLGVALLEAGHPAPAAHALEAAVRLAPRFPNAQAALGLALRELGRPTEAAGHFLAALADQPDHPQALFGAAETLRELGRPDQARGFYRRFLDVAPPGMAGERDAAARWAESP
jgi:tetratricopeptide (TPR) repeat protein